MESVIGGAYAVGPAVGIALLEASTLCFIWILVNRDSFELKEL